MSTDRPSSARVARAPFAAATAAAATLFAGAAAEAAVTTIDIQPRYTMTHITSVHAADQVAVSKQHTAAGSWTLARFDPSLGVLQSASLRLFSDVSAMGAVAATTDPFAPNQVVVGHGSVTPVFSGPGFEYAMPSLLSAATCQTSAVQLGCSAKSTSVSRPFDVVHEMDPAALLSRPGKERFTVQHSLRDEAAVTRAPTAPSSYVTESSWEVDALFVTYDFLYHASPSFVGGASQTTLDLDFGSILQGDPAALAFRIFDNPFRPQESVGFRLVEALGLGDTAALTTNVALGRNFGAGRTTDFTAFLDSSTIGAFGASYQFDLVETGPGVGHLSHALTLNLRGQVLAAPAAVPEPATWALMIGGFGLVGAALRRRSHGEVRVRPRAGAASRLSRLRTAPEFRRWR